MSRTVSKSQLKARMLAYFREVEETGEELVVTSHGRPVLRITPADPVRTAAEVFGDVRGTVALPDDDALNEPAAADVWADSDAADLVR